MGDTGRFITAVFLSISVLITTVISYLGLTYSPQCHFICQEQLNLEAFGFFVVQVYAISSVPALYFTLLFALFYSMMGGIWQLTLHLKTMMSSSQVAD